MFVFIVMTVVVASGNKDARHQGLPRSSPFLIYGVTATCIGRQNAFTWSAKRNKYTCRRQVV